MGPQPFLKAAEMKFQSPSSSKHLPLTSRKSRGYALQSEIKPFAAEASQAVIWPGASVARAHCMTRSYDLARSPAREKRSCLHQKARSIID